MDTIELRIDDLILPDMSREEGAVFKSVLLQLWDQADLIILDFKDVTFVSVSFLDEVVAKLFLTKSKPDIFKKLRIVNMQREDKDVLNSIISSRIRQHSERSKCNG